MEGRGGETRLWVEECCLGGGTKRRRKNESQIEVSIVQLPDSLVFDVLQRLPVASIFRFKCVSKGWLSLISDPCFPRFYNSQRITNISNTLAESPWTLLFQYKHNAGGSIPPDKMRVQIALTRRYPIFKSPRFTFQFLEAAMDKAEVLKTAIRVLDSSNGLVLCCATLHSQTLYYVCNPFTMMWVALPRSPSSQRVSIGFVVETNSEGLSSYHVVRIIQSLGYLFKLEFEIFSSKTSEWRKRKVSLPFGVYMSSMYPRAVPYKGILHWVDDGNFRIIAYDPEKDTKLCRLIDLPEDRKGIETGMLGASNGHLFYMEVADEFWEQPLQPHCLSVWMLENYDTGKWSLEYRTEHSQIFSSSYSVTKSIRSLRQSLVPLAFHPLKSNLVFLRLYNCLLIYNLRSRRCEVLRNDINPKAFLNSLSVFPLMLPRWPTHVP